jgi:hypothetical protein
MSAKCKAWCGATELNAIPAEDAAAWWYGVAGSYVCSPACARQGEPPPDPRGQLSSDAENERRAREVLARGCEVVTCAVCDAIGERGITKGAPSGWVVLDVQHWPGPRGDVLRVRVCGMCILTALGESLRERLEGN